MQLLRDFRPVYVVGIGLSRYKRPSEDSFVKLGLEAVRAALEDSGIPWQAVEEVYTAATRLGMAVSRPMLRYLGVTGIAMTQVENASASGSSAFRAAVRDVAAGFADVVLACGVDKARPGLRAESLSGLPRYDSGVTTPPVHYALLADEFLRARGAGPADLARVAVKNHYNGSLNPYAQRQAVRTMAEVLGDRPIAGDLTRLECCPVGEGAAAVIVCSAPALGWFEVDEGRAVSILSSAQCSEGLYGLESYDAKLTRDTTAKALSEASLSPEDLDVVELHDAFAIEELQYIEAMGLCDNGGVVSCMRDGEFDIGGRVAVSPSGGLLSMGHPIGPTGLGQIAEATRQLRGEAERRQQPNARFALTQLVGVGAVSLAHVLAAPR